MKKLLAQSVILALSIPVSILEVIAIMAPRRSPECAYAFSQISRLRSAINHMHESM